MLEIFATIIAITLAGAILGAITASVAVVLAEEVITDPIRSKLEKRYFNRPTFINERLAYLAGCPKCISFWIAALLAASICLWGGAWSPFLAILTVTYGSALLWIKTIR